jgi:hypothetical protein
LDEHWLTVQLIGYRVSVKMAPVMVSRKQYIIIRNRL